MEPLTVAERATLTRIIHDLDVQNAGKHINQTVSDELGRIFTTRCDFTCGCPGSFKEGLKQSPLSTLLKALLCVAA